MFSTDGYAFPETFYLGKSKIFKKQHNILNFVKLKYKLMVLSEKYLTCM